MSADTAYATRGLLRMLLGGLVALWQLVQEHQDITICAIAAAVYALGARAHLVHERELLGA